MANEISELSQIVRDFCAERDWDQFHTPKDVAIGLVTESAELLDLFRFKSDEQVREVLTRRREDVSDELADILYWVLRFADMNGFDLAESLKAKMTKNAAKYPADKVRGLNKKYDEY